MRIQTWHVVVLVIVIVLLFGANRLPDLAKALGQSLKIFKNEIKDLTEDSKPADATKDETPGDGTGPKV
jgi:sec-independent protein translocase protein TatA